VTPWSVVAITMFGVTFAGQIACSMHGPAGAS
jgi:hypothetical protein